MKFAGFPMLPAIRWPSAAAFCAAVTLACAMPSCSGPSLQSTPPADGKTVADTTPNPPESSPVASMKTLIPVAPDPTAYWYNVNDGVMGGLSDGRMRASASGTLIFFGTLSLENNGGFTSVRSKSSNLGLANGDTMVARLRGDGRTYQMHLYTPTNRTAFSHYAKFSTTAGVVEEIRIPVDSFKAAWFGRDLDAEGPVDAQRVYSLGFFLGDKKPGTFELEIESVHIIKCGAGSAPAERK